MTYNVLKTWMRFKRVAATCWISRSRVVTLKKSSPHLPKLMLHLQVNSLFHLVKYTPAGREAYCDAWNLRQLYTFAFRRQKDSDQRGQRPRDWLGEGCGWTCRDFLICCLICCLILCFVAVLWHNCLGICTFMKIRFAFSLHAIYIYIYILH